MSPPAPALPTLLVGLSHQPLIVSLDSNPTEVLILNFVVARAWLCGVSVMCLALCQAPRGKRRGGARLSPQGAPTLLD